MAQTAPPLPGEGTPRPLPRGARPQRSRDTRPRFQAVDGLWTALLAVVPVVTGLARHTDAVDIAAAVGIIALTYLLGWRSSGRSAGVIAGLLLATSGAFASSTPHAAQADLFALVSLCAVFAFVAGSSLAALALAAGTVWLRADGIALGLMLMTFTLIQHRRRALYGALLFFIPTLAAVIVPYTGLGLSLRSVDLGFHPALLIGLAAPATLLASWFLLPFLGEMTDAVRRARWLPTVAWTALYAALASAMAFGHADTVAAAALVPFLPLWYLLVGSGLARLLPTMTGDIPIPWLRYAVATLAVLSLVAIRARIEWAPPPRPSAVPARAAVPLRPVPMTPIVPHPAAAPAPPRPVAAPPATPPKATKPKPPPKATKPRSAPPAQHHVAKLKVITPRVRQYVMKNGRLVHRTKWAIQWDLSHPNQR